MVIFSESRSNCVGDDDSINVRVNEETSLSGRLMILMTPRDDWNMAETTSLLAEIVTFMVALEEGRVVRNILRATGLHFRRYVIPLQFVLTAKLKEHLRDEIP